MNSKIRQWIAAANLLREDTNADVVCPECGIGHLHVRDELIPDWSSKIDRFMICDNCGKYNILTMDKPHDRGSASK